MRQPNRQSSVGVLALVGSLPQATGFLVCFGIVAAWVLAANILAGGVLVAVAGFLIALSMLARPDLDGSWPLVRDTVVAVAILGGSVLVAAWPFLLHYGFIPTTRVPLEQSLDASEFAGFAGAAFIVLMAWLAWQLVRCGWSLALEGVVGPVELAVVPVLLVAALALAWLVGHLLVFLMLVFMMTGVVIWYLHRDRVQVVIPGLVLVAIGLSVVGQRLRLDDWTSQQNVPLQFSLLAWMMLAIAAIPALATALNAVRTHGPTGAGIAKGVAAAFGSVALVVVLGIGAVYPVMALPSRSEARLVETGATFDSWAFMANGSLTHDANGMPVEPYPIAGDLAAVEWIRENIEGLPVILETAGNPGTWGGRISALSGLPTVLGSPDVQRQQRPGMERAVDWRVADINAIYGSTGSYDNIVSIVLRYDIEYIYVGQLEQVTYGEASLAKFHQAVTDGMLEVAWQGDGVTIYHVVDAVG